jgi:hypothetical protein
MEVAFKKIRSQPIRNLIRTVPTYKDLTAMDAMVDMEVVCVGLNTGRAAVARSDTNTKPENRATLAVYGTTGLWNHFSATSRSCRGRDSGK